MSVTIAASHRPIRLGLLGSGARLREIVRRLLDHAPRGGLCVTSVYDPDRRSREVLRENLGCDFETASSDEAVIRNPEVDWILIGSWNNFHCRQAVLALEAGKDVFCEKPLATTFEDCLAIRDAVRASGRVFALGLVLRYSPHYRRIRDILDSGVVGKVISFEFNETLPFNHGGYIFGDWRRRREFSGGHVLEKCCHDLDLASWFVGSLPVRAASFGERNFFVPENAHRVKEIGPNAEGFPAYGEWGRCAPNLRNPFAGDADIADNQVAILEYASGVRATFHTNCNAGISERRLYLLGSHGALRADLISSRVEVRSIGWNSKIEDIDTNVADGHGGGDVEMARELYDTMARGARPRASTFEGLCSAITAFAVDQAMEDQKVVDLRPIWERADIDPFNCDFKETPFN